MPRISPRNIQKLCLSCHQFQTSKNNNLCMACKEHQIEHKIKRCTSCKVIQNWNNFNKKSDGLFGLQNYCKQCKSQHSVSSMEQRENFLKRMLRTCKSNNNARNRTNGMRDLKFTWTYHQMVARLKKQEDKCAISDLPMTFKPYSHWKCSPERIDNTKGYEDSNMTFICLEFQLGYGLQGSRELIDFLITVETRPHSRIEEIIKGEFIEEDYVRHCHIGMTHCSGCQTLYSKFYINTCEGRLVQLASHASGATRRRNELGRDHELSTVSAKDILKMLQNQEGKCYLTGHHLSFETGTWNCVSLERLNVNFGYNKTGNCVLIMQCFNTMDNTSRRSLANQPKEGSGGWTRAKVEYLKNSRGFSSSSVTVC